MDKSSLPVKLNRYIKFCTNEKRIFQKLNREVLKYCEAEGVEVLICDSHIDLYDAVYGKEDGFRELSSAQKINAHAGGFCAKYKEKKTGSIYFKIYLVKRDNPSTLFNILSHEVGHYIGLKYFNNGDEEFADYYAYIFAKKFLSPIEFSLVEPFIKIMAGEKLVYNKKDVTKHEVFFDMKEFLKIEEKIKKMLKDRFEAKYKK